MRQLNGAFVAPDVVITGDVVLSAGSNVWFGSVIRGDLARITLGPDANVQDRCVLHTDRDAPLVLEAGVVVGHGAILHGARVGADCLIGMGATLLSGSDIGPGSIVAAGCVVREGATIPPRSLVVGVPGRVVRGVSPDEIDKTRDIAARYREMAGRYVRGQIPFPYGQPGGGHVSG